MTDPVLELLSFMQWTLTDTLIQGLKKSGNDDIFFLSLAKVIFFGFGTGSSHFKKSDPDLQLIIQQCKHYSITVLSRKKIIQSF